MNAEHHEVEHHLMGVGLPAAWDWVKARAAGFNWGTFLALLLKYGPQIVQIIIDIINGMSREQLLEKYGQSLHDAIDAALRRAA